MTDYRSEIRGTIERIASRSPRGVGAPIMSWDSAIWSALIESGFAGLGIDDELGGSGGDLGDVMDAVHTVSALGICTPLIEHGLAGWLTAGAGLDLPSGTGTVARDVSELDIGDSGSGIRVSGTTRAVPWAAEADWLAILMDGKRPEILVIDLADDAVTISRASDLSGAPVADVAFEFAPIRSNRPAAVGASQLHCRGALVYAGAMAAAARTICNATSDYTRERTQFGRALSKFQAVQQRLAQLAATTALMEQVVADALSSVLSEASDAKTSVASAKSTVSSGARSVAAAGHQLHGAIGFTSEHALGRHTMSLLTWRDRWGNENYWAEVIAAEILEAGSEVWDLVSGFGLAGQASSAAS